MEKFVSNNIYLKHLIGLFCLIFLVILVESKKKMYPTNYLEREENDYKKMIIPYYFNLVTDKLNNFQINEQYHYDQIFICHNIYPFIKNDCTIHDEFFEKKPFPTKRINYEFVGEVFDENENNVAEHTEVLMNHYKQIK